MPDKTSSVVSLGSLLQFKIGDLLDILRQMAKVSDWPWFLPIGVLLIVGLAVIENAAFYVAGGFTHFLHRAKNHTANCEDMFTVHDQAL